MRYILLLALCLCLPCSAGVLVQLEQSGWERGGPLQVVFAGEDSDGDGALVLGELSRFSAVWITPEGERTSWELPDFEPDGFFFEDPGDYLFFLRNPEFSLVNVSFEGEALASVFDEFLFPVSSTNSPASAVPEPSSMSLIAMGGVAMVVGLSRRSRRR